jgi:hypothetical protein
MSDASQEKVFQDDILEQMQSQGGKNNIKSIGY